MARAVPAPAAKPPVKPALRPVAIPVPPKPVSKPAVGYRSNVSPHLQRIKAIQGIGAGKALVILGNGPSLAEIDTVRLQDQPRIDLMSINHPDDRVWPTRYWAFCDVSQYHRHLSRWQQYDGTIINSTAISFTKPGSVHVRNLGGKGWSRDLTHGFYVGRSTVFANMQTAIWMGYEHVYIIGCDMLPDPPGDGPLWFYGTNPDVAPSLRKERFKLEAEYYEHAASILEPGERARFTFCSSYNPHNFVQLYGTGPLDHRLAADTIIERWAG